MTYMNFENVSSAELHVQAKEVTQVRCKIFSGCKQKTGILFHKCPKFGLETMRFHLEISRSAN